MSISPNARVAIDARKIHDFGIGTYIRCLVEELAARDDELRFVLLVPPQGATVLEDLDERFETVVEGSPVYSLRAAVTVPRTLRRVGADLYHATHYVLPATTPCPTVVTIHDLIHLLFPDLLPHWPARLYARAMLSWAARRADRVITVSQWSADDLVEHLGIPAHRIDVIPNGVEERFRTPPEADEVEDAIALHRLPLDYLLFVGNPKAHKNLERLMRAWARAHRDGQVQEAMVCVGVGAEAHRLHRLAAQLGVADSVHLLGFVEDRHLPSIYRAASVVALPSLYEGFGLPVLEAMAAGSAVITSRDSAMAEVVGDAARLVDPRSEEDIHGAVVELFHDPEKRRRLEALGRERAGEFRWSRAAAATVDCYRRVLAGDGAGS